MKIKRFNDNVAKNSKITYDDLMDWMTDNEEDVVLDGPFSFTEQEEQIFIDMVNQNSKLLKFFEKEGIIEKGGKVEDFYDLGSEGGNSKKDQILLNVFADFLNLIYTWK